MTKPPKSPLDSPTSRLKLAPRTTPYADPTRIADGIGLGYRRNASGAGKWCIRRGTSWTVLAEADDFHRANGETILTCYQARERAATQYRTQVLSAAGKGPITIRELVREWALERGEISEQDETREGSNLRYLKANVSPDFLDRDANDADGNRDALTRLKRAIISRPKQVRSNGNGLKYSEKPMTDEDRRARKASCKRIFSMLKSALNMGAEARKVRERWWEGQAFTFKDVDSARVDYFTLCDAMKFLAAAGRFDSKFADLARGALESGARYGELTRALVEDFQPPRVEEIDGESVMVAGRLLIRQLNNNLRRSKSGKTRDVILTSEGSDFFAELVNGRGPHERVFLRSGGHPWRKSQTDHPMTTVCDAAKIRRICFHSLRHTWASLSIMAGMPLDVAARNLGHADISMVQRHYGHLAKNYLEAQVLRAAPRFA